MRAMLLYRLVRSLLAFAAVCASIPLAACASSRTSASIPLLAERYDSLLKTEKSTESLSTRNRTVQISHAYDELFSLLPDQRDVKGLTDSDLTLLFDASSRSEFYTAKPSYARNMLLLFGEMEARGIATRESFIDMQSALVESRMLAEARQFSKSHPSAGLVLLPEFRDGDNFLDRGPTEWKVSQESPLLTRENIVMSSPAQVIVIGSPLCHFSQNAIHDLSHDAELMSALTDHVQWLAPPDGSINFDVFQNWNREHPEAPMDIAYRREEWPMIDSWNTPTFYFFKRGKLVAEVAGWPKEGNRNELRRALRLVGLLQ